MSTIDQSIPDHVWWFSDFAEFEDFVGIGEERTLALAEHLDEVHYPQVIIERLLRANNIPLDKFFVIPKPPEQPERAIWTD